MHDVFVLCTALICKTQMLPISTVLFSWKTFVQSHLCFKYVYKLIDFWLKMAVLLLVWLLVVCSRRWGLLFKLWQHLTGNHATTCICVPLHVWESQISVINFHFVSLVLKVIWHKMDLFYQYIIASFQIHIHCKLQRWMAKCV